ncbi:unnamed protein product, partial [Caenorhabditis auriculariae]
MTKTTPDVNELVSLIKKQGQNEGPERPHFQPSPGYPENNHPPPVANAPTDPSCVVAALSARIPMFEYDLEAGKTFPKWINRYGEVITRLLLNKLPDEIYEQFAAKICPKNPSTESYADVVATLSDYFDVKRSLLSWRFACTQISRLDENPAAYTSRINETCEKAILKDWIKGLDAAGDTQIRAYFIKFMERRVESKQPTTIMDLCEEWLRIQQTGTPHPFVAIPNPPATSDKCHRKGHLAKFCKSTRVTNPRKSTTSKPNTWTRCKAVTVANAESPQVQAVRRFIDVEVDGVQIPFQMDTGSDLTLVGTPELERLGKPPLENVSFRVKNASGSDMDINGRFKCNFQLKDSHASGYAYVRNSGNLLGLDWLEKSTHMSYHLDQMINSIENGRPFGGQLKEEFPEVFAEGLGKEKFHKFIYGRSFTLRADHKPLLPIFGNKNGIPVHSQNRLEALQQDDVVIAKVEVEVQEVLRSSIRRLPLTNAVVQTATRQDKDLLHLMKFVRSGKFPTNIPPTLRSFASKRDDLNVVEGCLMIGERIVIPKTLQREVLQELHASHAGLDQMKRLARSVAFWPGIDADCENFVRNCKACSLHSKTPRKVPLIHIDFAGPDQGQWYLVVVDAKSKYPEVKIVHSISAANTVKVLKEIFARNGYPETIVSDNGTQFTSQQFADMCQNGHIQHIRTAPYCPQSNGQAE